MFNLLAMGDTMDTDAEDGTNSSDAFDGLVDWLDDHGIPAFVYARRARDNQNVSYKSIRNMLKAGGNMTVSYGRYTLSDGEFERGTGHAITLVGLQRSSAGVLTLQAHDPIQGGGSLNTQSATQVREVHPVEETRNIEGDVVKVLRWGTGTDPYVFIDGWMAILPLMALTNLTAGAVALYTAGVATGQVTTAKIKLPFKAPLADIAMHHSAPFATVLAEGSGEVWTLNLGDRTWTRLQGVTGARFIAHGGRHARLFVVQGSQILAFDADDLDERTGDAPLARFDARASVDALSYDHRKDRLIVACKGGKRLLSLSPALSLHAEIATPGLTGSSRLTMSVNGRDSTLLLSRAGSPDVATLRWLDTGAVASGRFRLLAKGETAANHVDSKGRLFVNEGGKIASFDMDGNRIKGSPFDGLRVGPLLKVSRSTNVLDPVLSARKAWKN
ncbi:hypothetical protein [Ideonella sp. A 288]|uniref:hypothetical protein n=1 Tax=Ideonella sp. A 288 TaxID=1962181 RepID=UPI0011848FCD|nr:hypothetical protein [Ideonella sp. A 288]